MNLNDYIIRPKIKKKTVKKGEHRGWARASTYRKSWKNGVKEMLRDAKAAPAS